jgi:hypothetical protein
MILIGRISEKLKFEFTDVTFFDIDSSGQICLIINSEILMFDKDCILSMYLYPGPIIDYSV